MGTEAAQLDYMDLYREAFAKYRAHALWFMRRLEEPTPADALAVAAPCASKAICRPAASPNRSN